MAQGGTHAVLLANNGFVGDPNIFDGTAEAVKAPWWKMAGCVAYSPAVATSGPGERWLMPPQPSSLIKLPSHRLTHGALAGFSRIIDGEGLGPLELKSVDVYTGRTIFVFKMERPEVSCEEDAQFSMPT